ncbi:MAG TPA: hypothetical protein PKG52_09000 [bacterium]|nr:hypothetical protein [bacterium]HPS30108.1 hypothetical protein [bacterium]
MKKIFLIAAAVILLTSGLVAQNGKKVEMYVQPTFGFGLAFDNYNAFGLDAGIDIVFKVWENNKKAAGKMFAGIDTGFQYWVPTKSIGIYSRKHHIFTMPVTGYFSYEFKVNAGALAYAGPFITFGISFDVDHTVYEKDRSHADTDFYPDFANSFGGSLVFTNGWVFKQSFAWSSANYYFGMFLLEAGYRF